MRTLFPAIALVATMVIAGPALAQIDKNTLKGKSVCKRECRSECPGGKGKLIVQVCRECGKVVSRKETSGVCLN
jgi:hypothetical protein